MNLTVQYFIMKCVTKGGLGTLNSHIEKHTLVPTFTVYNIIISFTDTGVRRNFVCRILCAGLNSRAV
jgi:hypothetical protein